MVRAPSLSVIAVVLLFLAGCLGPAEESVPPADDQESYPAIIPAEDVSPFTHDPLPAPLPTHDHADASQHEVEINMELIGRPAPEESSDVHYWNGAIPVGLNIRFGELDVRGDWLAQCSRDSGGAYLWDISNRSEPVLTGRLLDAGSCADIKLTADAEYAIIGGNKLYDLRDKANPVMVLDPDQAGTPGCHMCSIVEIDGEEYVVLSAQGAGFSVVKFTRDPPSMELVGTWRKDLVQDSIPTLAEQDIASTVHDQYVYFDPILNKTLVVPAMWDYGIYVVDISDPTNPTDLGHWGDYRGESGNIHTTAVDIREIDGEMRRIIVGATETGTIIGPLSAAEPGYVYIFDATDVSNIQLLGKWANPGMRSTGFDPTFFPVGEYSAHNLQFTQGRLYMAHYHAGVWVVDVDAFLKTNPAPKGDVRTPLPDDIPNLGMYLIRDPEVDAPGSVWDVVVSNGYIYASDYALGLFVLRYLGDPLNDPAYTGTA